MHYLLAGLVALFMVLLAAGAFTGQVRAESGPTSRPLSAPGGTPWTTTSHSGQ